MIIVRTLCEKVSVALNQLAGHCCGCQLGQGITLIALIGTNGNLLDLVNSKP